MSTFRERSAVHSLSSGGAEPGEERPSPLSWSRKRALWLEIGFVVLLFLVALFLRTWQLDHIPPGLYNDEAAYGMDGRALLAGDLRVFYERNNGREPLFIYLLALAFQSLGATPYALRMTAAVVGAATVVTSYWMVRALFRFAPELNDQPARWYAAWTALFLTFSYWHLSLSRVGFRAITLPLALTIAFALFWLVWRHLRTPGGVPWGLASLGGLALSLPLYTYTAGRMAPLLFAFTVAATWLLAPGFAIDRARLAKTAVVMALLALLGALPLLFYFVQHPTAFGAHALEVSVLNTQYAGDNPLLALLRSAVRTFLLFGVLPDENLRHNPAQIPALDPLLATWLLLGSGLAVVYWRRLTTLFVLAWLLLLAMPAILSSEGVPHSLRMIGMLPIVYVLPMLAMAWVTTRAPRRYRLWLRWLPLPFLLLAAYVGVTSYFGAWTPIERFRAAFRTDYADFARTLAASDTSDTLWVLPLIDAQALADGRFNTIDFFQRDPGAFTTLPVNEATAAAALTQLTQGRRLVNVLRPTDAPDLQATSWLFADVKGLLELLLRRNSATTPTTGQLAGIPYTSYALGNARDFALPPTERTLPGVVFGDLFQLTGVNLGGGNQWTWQEDALALPADQPLWAVLRWSTVADAPTTQHKTSLVLRDAVGNIVGQSDALLISDRQPGVLDSTYQVIDLLPGTLPGRYRLELRVYEDATGRIYPVTQAGRRTAFLSLAEVMVQPSLRPGAQIAPQVILDDASMPHDFQLIGYDLPRTEIAPGEALPLMLYLHAPITPTTDYAVRITLTDGSGVVAEEQETPGGAAWPPSAWRAGEMLRTPAPLRVAPTLASGNYRLQAAVMDGAHEVARVDLGEITVSGRPHVLTAPPIDQPLDASFDESVRLVGVNAASAITIAPGATISLTLVWQPASPSLQSLVRFVQVLDASGALVAQQDTIPCDGGCPASSWLEGEYLLDPVNITLPTETPVGAYQLIVGWYDADTQQRLPGFDAAGQPLAGDVFTLPTALNVSH
ncbi:MAG TPA: hypothetical protein DCL15_03975 [Chloroflexi bacterium]|nr:hypothetical protein [Chloroflexota bacterium]HHW86252.1 hypothetical protein [Chloroflexota bacterium]